MRVQTTAAQLVRSDLADQVVIPALDALSADQRRSIRATNPYSYLHAIHEPETLEAETMRAAADASARGLNTLLAAGVFQPGPAGMYAYRLRYGGLTHTSIVATVPVEEYDSVIVPHEKTRPARVAYLAHYRATVGHVSSPVAVAHPPSAAVDAVIDRATRAAPLLEFTTSDAKVQTIWGVEDTDAAIAAFANVQRAYVSDGHHRVAAARTVPGDRDRLVLTALTSTRAVHVLPFHRLVQDHPVEEMLDRMHDVQPLPDGPRDPAVGRVVVGSAGRWWSARLPGDSAAPVPDSMDAARLHTLVLTPLGLAQNDPRLQYIPGLDGPARVAADHPNATVIAMAPAAFDDIIAAAEAGRTLPLKSTYVRPKPHSGIFLAPT